MRSIAPRVEGIPGVEEHTFGGSEEFLAMTVARVPTISKHQVHDQVTRWTPTPDERRRLAEGEDVFVHILVSAHSRDIVPHRVTVGYVGPSTV